MVWIYLLVAGIMEILFSISLKYSEGFTRLWPSLAFLLTGGISLYLLSLALRTMPVGTAYAVWTGIGAAGTVLVGILVLREPVTALRLASLALIIAGVIGLRAAEG